MEFLKTLGVGLAGLIVYAAICEALKAAGWRESLESGEVFWVVVISIGSWIWWRNRVDEFASKSPGSQPENPREGG